MRIVRLALLLFSAFLGANPPPDYLSFAGGYFNVPKKKWRTGEFSVEYKFHIRRIPPPTHYVNFRPLLGVMTTLQGSVYAYLGINFDLLFWKHIHFAPGFAAGYYGKGRGKNLWYPLEFRSGVELGWQFDDASRLGIHFYHISNAHLGRKNPGEESLVLFYDLPLVKGFPFNIK